MSFQTYLENLKEKPEHVRKKYAFWTSFGFTAIVFLFWLSSFTSIGIGNANDTIAKTVKEAGTPAQSMIAGVGGFFEDLKDLIFGPKKVTFEAVDVRPGKK